jgi:metal-sulfur cluster biosynthetic enzyme
VVSEKKVYKQLKKVLDPELNINIVDLGLIYEVKTKQDGQVRVLMTLTFPGCPLSSVIHEEINSKLKELPGVKKIDLKLTFEPPWDFSKVSEEAKLQLGVI